MDKGVITRLFKLLVGAGLRSEAPEILKKKIPKTVYIAYSLFVPYDTPDAVKNSTSYIEQQMDWVIGRIGSKAFACHADPGRAVDKEMDRLNRWGGGRTRRNTICMVELSTEADLTWDKWEETWEAERVPADMILGFEWNAIDQNHNGIYYFDHDYD
jgi:hypothetical protein